MRLVYLSPVKWNSFTQRPHEFARWFNKKYKGNVLWIDPYPTRLPCLSDLKRIKHINGGDGEEKGTWLEVLNTKAFPLEPLPLCDRLNNLIYWQKIINKIRLFACKKPCYLCIGKPSALSWKVLETGLFKKTCYDAMDDFPAFYTGISARAIASAEKKIISSVDHILVSSTHLVKRFRSMGHHVDLVRNGSASSRLPFSAPGTSCTPPVLGYVGTIGKWFDWDLVVKIAESARDFSIEIVGPVYQGPKTALPENVKVMPPLRQPDALKRMTAFSVGLIPFKTNQLTASVDPIKYYEYRGLGLPVLSTDFGEMSLRKNEKGVYLISKHSKIREIVIEAYKHESNKMDVTQFRSENDWAARFDGLSIFP